MIVSEPKLYRFSNYRDHREAVQQYEGIVAACLAYAFKKVTESGGEVVRRDITFVPRKIDTQPTIVDVALTTHLGTPMKTWSIDQVSSWLNAVMGEKHSSDIRKIVQSIETVVEQALPGTLNTLRNYPNTIGLPFGTTTIAGRRKKEQMLKSGDVKKTAGQGLITLYRADFKSGSFTLNLQNEFRSVIQDAVRRRLDYDTLMVQTLEHYN